MSFNEYMRQYIDIDEIRAVFICIVVILVSVVISRLIMYFADQYYNKVIEPAFLKYKRGEKLTEKEQQIIEKYKI